MVTMLRAIAIRWSSMLAAALALISAGCGTNPPASQVPDARAAIDRVHASQDCGLGIQASAKIDHFGQGGRVRGDLLMFALWPERIRMDIIGPMNVGVVATLTADDGRFALLDLREKKFLQGPASACNIARLTTVPIPGHVLVSLLRGEAPVLKHEPAAARLSWSKSGYYVVVIGSVNDAEEELHIAPHPDDFGKPWQEQRMRVRSVEVRQKGVTLYHADLDDHEPGKMASARVDPDGLDAPIPPSGPVCNAELPKKIHVEVPGKDEDVQFRYETVTWNPPVTEGLFTQPVPGGLEVLQVTCR